MKANLDNSKDAGNPLLSLRKLVQSDLEKVDGLIFKLIENKINLIPEISEHTISSGGKRLRPILTLASAKMCGYEGTVHTDLAACVEFIHTATLLHDDVVDKSDLRRGEHTANSIWGNKESVLVGDYLLGKSFELMGAAQSLEIYKILSNAAVVISEGEVMQLAASGNIEGGKDQYINIISAKTAELFASSCEVGAVLAKRDKKIARALREYGLNLGIAFQIIDDLLDYFSSNDKMGKNVGDDFREQKVTLPVVYSYVNATAEEKIFWDRCINQGVQENGDVEQAVAYMKSHDVFAKVVAQANFYAKKAKTALDVFEDSEYKTAMRNVVTFAVEREF